MTKKNFCLGCRPASRVLPGILMAVLLSACDRNMADLEQYASTIKARPAKPIEPIPVIKPYVRFIYPDQDADPFDASVLTPDDDKQLPDSVAIDSNRAPEYLESFPLDSLSMVGTVFRQAQLWALIRVPNGSVHRVKKGNYIGKNHGKILEVGEVSIQLTEIVENGFGGYKERDNEVTISTPNKEI